MNLYLYRKYERDQTTLIFETQEVDILVADRQFQEQTGLDPTRLSDVACEIRPGKLINGFYTRLHALPTDPPSKIPPPTGFLNQPPKKAKRAPARSDLLSGPDSFLRNAVRWFRAQDMGKCFYCGQLLVVVRLKPGERHPPDLRTLDHVHARTRGGTVKVQACAACNTKKGSRTIDEARKLLTRHRDGTFFGESEYQKYLNSTRQ